LVYFDLSLRDTSYLVSELRFPLAYTFYPIHFPHPQAQTQNHQQSTFKPKHKPCLGRSLAWTHRATEHNCATLQSWRPIPLFQHSPPVLLSTTVQLPIHP